MLSEESESNTRARVAEGLSRRGLLDPLIARASDPVIYPFVLRVLADGPADFVRFEQLAHLAPPPNLTDQWAAAVRQLSARLNTADLLSADQLLSTIEHADTVLRIMILSDATVHPTQSLTVEMRVQLFERLIPLLLEVSEPLRALELLEGLNGASLPPQLVEARFRAAVLAGRFNVAATIHPEPRFWIDLLDDLAEKDPDAARRVRDEISRRFGETLTEEDLSAFDAACAKLPPEQPVAEPPAEPPPAGEEDEGPPP